MIWLTIPEYFSKESENKKEKKYLTATTFYLFAVEMRFAKLSALVAILQLILCFDKN